MQLIKELGIGINIGNTFEACGDWIKKYTDGTVTDYEKAWGSPVITKDIIEGYANEGFGVLRIPVAWSNRMAPDGLFRIDSELMKRITQVVEWTIETGMFAIVNIHWDDGWMEEFPDKKDECTRRFTTMWEQIADNFRDFGDHLIFESQNEDLGWRSVWNKWAGSFGKAASYALVNEINQKFVDIIRNSGGQNGARYLLISGYNTDFYSTCDPLFIMPHDPENKCAVSLHYYNPPFFAILEEDADWGKVSSTWGSDDDYRRLEEEMDMVKERFTDNGVPVIISEYGCPKNNKEPESVRRFLSAVCRAAYERSLCPVLWDTPDCHYDRRNNRLSDPWLRNAYMNIIGSNPSERDSAAV